MTTYSNLNLKKLEQSHLYIVVGKTTSKVFGTYMLANAPGIRTDTSLKVTSPR